MSNNDPQHTILFNLLIKHFNEEELKTLCFHFDPRIDYESLGGSGRAGNARELVAYCERRGQTDQLVNLLTDMGVIQDGKAESNITENSLSIDSKPAGLNTPDGQKLALVMKGGGVKGFAYVGALEELEKYYQFDWYVGTSAGAIAAALLGAGYTVDELSKILSEKDFRDFLDAGRLKRIFNLFAYGGLYEANEFTDWIDELLSKKLRSAERVTMKMLPYRVTVYASRRYEDTLVFDSKDENCKDMPVAYAVRCSMAIPIFFTPQSKYGMRVFDGGLRNNYPVRALLKDNPKLDFIGLYLGDEHYKPKNQNRSLFGDLLSIWTETEDIKALSDYRDRTIIIDPNPIGTIDFSLSEEEKKMLMKVGQGSALEFLQKENMISGEDRVSKVKEEANAFRKPLIQKRRKQKKVRIIIRSLTIVTFIATVVFGSIFFLRTVVQASVNESPIMVVQQEPTTTPMPIVMTGDFNIAVADFIASPSSSDGEIALQISDSIFKLLDLETQLVTIENVEVAHKNIGEIVEAREARDLAETINAHIVIYGRVNIENNQVRIYPEFYVSEAFRADVGEINGQHRLAIPVDIPLKEISNLEIEAGNLLQQRIAILTSFTKGLAYLATDNILLASQSLNNAIELSEEYGNFDGKEVLYLFAAHVARLQADLENSENLIDAALNLNPSYGRAYIAKGNIYYDLGNYNLARDDYLFASNLDKQPIGAYIVEKANYGLGNIYFNQYVGARKNSVALESEVNALAELSLNHYQSVIDSFNAFNQPESKFTELAFNSYRNIGLINELQKDVVAARTAYEQALNLTQDSSLIAEIENQIENLP